MSLRGIEKRSQLGILIARSRSVHLNFDNFYIIIFLSRLTVINQNKKMRQASKSKVSEPPKFDPDLYVTMTIPREEVIEIKQAFDIFDSDLSGSIDPS